MLSHRLRYLSKQLFTPLLIIVLSKLADYERCSSGCHTMSHDVTVMNQLRHSFKKVMIKVPGDTIFIS